MAGDWGLLLSKHLKGQNIDIEKQGKKKEKICRMMKSFFRKKGGAESKKKNSWKAWKELKERLAF